MSTNERVERATPREAIEALRDHYVKQGLEVSLTPRGEELLGGRLVVDIANGRKSRPITFNGRDALELLGANLTNPPFDLSKISFLGDYGAFVDRNNGQIEAMISGGVGAYDFQRRLSAISRSSNETDLAAEIDSSAPDEGSDRQLSTFNEEDERGVSIFLNSEKLHLSISAPSEVGKRLLPARRGAPTLKISGSPSSTHEEALNSLEKWAASLFFDFSLKYDLPMTIPRLRQRRRPLAGPSHAHMPPALPQSFYDREATQLYMYARTTRGLPLLEFLAYYQSIEFFFDRAVREDVIRSVRSAVADPRFSAHNERDILDLIKRASSGSSPARSEREQLRVTIRGATQESQLRTVLQNLEDNEEYFLQKKQKIRGVAPLSLQSNVLQDDVADRIYALRCRIVHTKELGRSKDEGALLPSSDESQFLEFEIPLVRYIAEQLILSRARPITR